MAATFGSLNLEELGVIGEPGVEYARFETEVSEPRGYDGGVLANFRRGATTIKFNLALTGTRSEITNKLNALTAELAKGQQELVLPTMTEGFHFNASANCALQPSQYIDGFVLPLEFAIPDGTARSNPKTSNFEELPERPASVKPVVTSAVPVDWEIVIEPPIIVHRYTDIVPDTCALRLLRSFGAGDVDEVMFDTVGRYDEEAGYTTYESFQGDTNLIINSRTQTVSCGEYIFAPRGSTKRLFDKLVPGNNNVITGANYDEPVEIKPTGTSYITWSEVSIW